MVVRIRICIDLVGSCCVHVVKGWPFEVVSALEGRALGSKASWPCEVVLALEGGALGSEASWPW